MREGTCHHLSFLDQILLADFFIKSFGTFWEVKIGINRANLPNSLSLLKKISIGGAKFEHFFAFIAHAR